MTRPNRIYLAGSLRNPLIPSIATQVEVLTGLPVFSDWFAAGPNADDSWKEYEQALGYTYSEALKRPAAVNVYEFDKRNIDASDIMVLVYPAGKSGHLELGYHLGKGKRGYILGDGQQDRWDVMLQFATGYARTIDELAGMILTDTTNFTLDQSKVTIGRPWPY